MSLRRDIIVVLSSVLWKIKSLIVCIIKEAEIVEV